MVRPKKYNIATHILTAGRDLISRHVEYIFNMLCHEHAPDLINSIVFNSNKPLLFGNSMGSAKAISINLIKHFEHALEQSKENPQYSIRAMLIMELVGTCLHEAKHIIMKDDPKVIDDDDSQHQEDEAEKYEGHRWNVAKTVNVEIMSFGPVLDDLITIYYKELSDAREAGTMTDLQEQQLYMLDNGILYYDTRNSICLKSVFDFFNYFSSDKEGWDRTNIPVFEEVEEFEETTETTVDTAPPAEVAKEEDIYGDEEIFSEEEIAESLEDVSNILHSAVTETGPSIVPDGYDPLMGMEMCENIYNSNDSFVEEDEEYHDMSSIDSEMDTAMSAKELETSPVQAQPERAMSPEANAMINISKIVMHRLFNHIYSKCGWNGLGKFTNPNAILDPVNINDIEGASELFTRADSIDADGKYKVGVPTDGFLRGVRSNDGLPMYKLYVTFKGVTQKRTFIPQNPDKMNNGQPTNWAKKVMAGHRIAMLLQENGSPKLYLETTPGQPLGQEKLTICNWDKK